MTEQLKKTILFIIDSFNPKAFRQALERKMVPAMDFLINRGYFSDRCVSVFPTMTPTCSATIATGTPPSDHQVPGFVWYSRPENRIVNYGISPRAVWNMGVKRVIQDLLFNLNHIQLGKKVKTLYESLEEAGFTTGAVNPFIFRAGRPHRARIPLVMQLLSAFRLGGRLWGPESLYLGQICPPESPFWGVLNIKQYLKKFGINDDYSGTVGRWLISNGKQPDLLTIYLPDTDGYAHRYDPNRTEASLQRADSQVAKVLGAFPSWDEALRRNNIIVVGDHSQSLIGTGGDSLVNLREELKEFSQVCTVEKNGDAKDIALCVNERMCHIYILGHRERLLPALVKRLGGIAGVDQVAWRDGEWYRLIQAGVRRLSFRPGRDWWDQYGQGWSLDGDPGAVGAETRGHSLVFGDYPDALAQIADALDCNNSGDIIVTAKPGYEFYGEFSSKHPGCGSHGSLHRDDTLVPLVVAGAPFGSSMPRLLDLAPFIRSRYGLD